MQDYNHHCSYKNILTTGKWGTMKNQYFGDVGDYGKYGLLRFLAGNNIKIAVNWYLTPDDGSNDGNISQRNAKNLYFCTP
jgi:hypothetical protein